MSTKPLILIVDDDVPTCHLFQSMFSVLDMDVMTARDGVVALQILRETQPDLIIVDLLLPAPGPDGWSLIDYVKRHTHLKHIPVLAVSAVDYAENVQRAAAAGCDGFMAKPVMLRSLHEEVQHLLNVDAV